MNSKTMKPEDSARYPAGYVSPQSTLHVLRVERCQRPWHSRHYGHLRHPQRCVDTVLTPSTALAFSSLSSPSSPLSPLEPPSRCGAARPDPCLTSRRLNVSTPTQPGWCRQESRCVIERTSSGLPHIPHTDLPQHTPNHLISSSVAVCMWFSHNVTFPSMCISGLEPLPHHHHRYHRTSAFSRPAAVHSALYRSASARWH